MLDVLLMCDHNSHWPEVAKKKTTAFIIQKVKLQLIHKAALFVLSA